MLAPHALDIAVIISSFIASLRFTFVDILKTVIVKLSYALVSGITNKSRRPGRNERPIALAHVTPILHSAK